MIILYGTANNLPQGVCSWLERSVQMFIPYERPFSLVFWKEEWLVGGDPFYLKFFVNRPSLERNRIRAFDWYRPRWPSMTLNGVIALILCFFFFTEFDSFTGRLCHSGWYNVSKIVSPSSSRSMWAQRERRKSRSALQSISVAPAPRSVPASRSVPLHRFSATPAHRSAPLHPIFGSLRSALRSDNKVRNIQNYRWAN